MVPMLTPLFLLIMLRYYSKIAGERELALNKHGFRNKKGWRRTGHVH